MTSKLRVEFIRAAPSDGTVGALLGAQTLTVTSLAVQQSEPAPLALLSSIYGLTARLTGISGAVCATFDGSPPSETNGLRIAAGDEARVVMNPGVVIKCVESADQSDPDGIPSSWPTVEVGEPFTPGIGLAAWCTQAGSAVLAASDGSEITVPLGVEFNQFPFAVVNVVSTTATATFYVLR